MARPRMAAPFAMSDSEGLGLTHAAVQMWLGSGEVWLSGMGAPVPGVSRDRT